MSESSAQLIDPSRLPGLLTETRGRFNVVALADLKLDVTDPSGPVAVGAFASPRGPALRRK